MQPFPFSVVERLFFSLYTNIILSFSFILFEEKKGEKRSVASFLEKTETICHNHGRKPNCVVWKKPTTMSLGLLSFFSS